MSNLLSKIYDYACEVFPSLVRIPLPHLFLHLVPASLLSIAQMATFLLYGIGVVHGPTFVAIMCPLLAVTATKHLLYRSLLKLEQRESGFGRYCARSARSA